MKYPLTLICLIAVMFVSNGQQIVFSESFDNGIPDDWTVIDGDNFSVHPSVAEFQPAWIGLEDPQHAGRFVAGSTSFFEPEGKAYRFLITPKLTLGSYGNFFSWESRSHDPSFPDWIMILISTTGNQIEDFTDTLFRLNNEFPTWTPRTVALNDSNYLDQEVYIAIVNHTNQGFKLYVDDVQLEINNPVSIESFTVHTPRLYPNPVSGDLLKIHSDETIIDAQISDASGKLLQQIEVHNNAIDVSNIQNGLYFITINTTQGSSTQRFQKL
mgnify:CR=1 FL=1